MRSETQLRIGIQPTSGIDIDLTAGTPRASTGNLSSDISRGISLKNKAATVVLAFGMLGGAKLALDSTPTSGQEPSAVPSAEPSLDASPLPSVTPDPETGLLPCPTPTPEPSKAPLPSLPPDIGKIPGGEVLFAQGANSNGETVIVTLAQEVPASVTPSAPASPAASEGPKTALVKCNPNTIPPDSIKILLESEHEPITLKQFKAIIKKASIETSRYFRESGAIPNDTPREDAKFFTSILTKLLKNPDAEANGKEFAGTIVLQVQKAQQINAEGDTKAMTAIMEIAAAYERAAVTFLRYVDTNTPVSPSEFNKWMEDWATELGVK